MATTTAPTFRYVGITDERTVCEHCGKANLRHTVVLALLDADGNVAEFVRCGSSCAADVLGVRGGAAKVRKAPAGAARRTRAAAAEAREKASYYGFDPETGEIAHPRGWRGVRARYQLAHRNWVGVWSTEQRDAAITDMITRQVAAVREANLIGA